MPATNILFQSFFPFKIQHLQYALPELALSGKQGSFRQAQGLENLQFQQQKVQLSKNSGLNPTISMWTAKEFFSIFTQIFEIEDIDDHYKNSTETSINNSVLAI